jgi:hypothetical protein
MKDEEGRGKWKGEMAKEGDGENYPQISQITQIPGLEFGISAKRWNRQGRQVRQDAKWKVEMAKDEGEVSHENTKRTGIEPPRCEVESGNGKGRRRSEPRKHERHETDEQRTTDGHG